VHPELALLGMTIMEDGSENHARSNYFSLPPLHTVHPELALLGFPATAAYGSS
jgi:hypothetical protein